MRSFLSGTTCESLVHKLGHNGPRTTKELLDIATNHASGEEAVGAIFDHPKGKTKRDEDTDEGASSHPSKKKNKQRRKGSLVAATNRKGGRKPTDGTRTTSRSCSKDYVQTILSLSSIYIRTAVS